MSFDSFCEGWNKRQALRSGTGAAVAALLLFFAASRPASAQVTPDADAGGITLSAGATGSGYYVQYGERKMLGIAGFADLDSRSRLGLEAEARFLEFHQTANVHLQTYMGGLRYHFELGRFQPYVKGVAGYGQFNFPYNYAKGSYWLYAPGGGVDYTLTKRIKLRLVDCEYQYWPQFTYGAMTSVGVSSGISFKIF